MQFAFDFSLVIFKNHDLILYFTCISSVFLFYFFCMSYAIFVHCFTGAQEIHELLKEVHVLLLHFIKECIRNA